METISEMMQRLRADQAEFWQRLRTRRAETTALYKGLVERIEGAA